MRIKLAQILVFIRRMPNYTCLCVITQTHMHANFFFHKYTLPAVVHWDTKRENILKLRHGKFGLCVRCMSFACYFFLIQTSMAFALLNVRTKKRKLCLLFWVTIKCLHINVEIEEEVNFIKFFFLDSFCLSYLSVWKLVSIRAFNIKFTQLVSSS